MGDLSRRDRGRWLGLFVALCALVSSAGCAQGRAAEDAALPDALLDAPRADAARDAAGTRRDGGCGAVDTACCVGGEACQGILVCREGTCRECGRPGDPCCDGEGCNAGLSCELGICRGCGAVGQPCCPGTAPCEVGGRCVSGSCIACECAPAERRETDCERCGTRAQVCLESCTWGPIGECSGMGECEPGAMEAISCGFCGERSRSCDATCRWGLVSECSGGECAPGSTRPGTGCGACQVFECSSSCRWPTACTGCSCGALTGCRPSGCPANYHIARMVCDESCGPCGGLLNNPVCEPDCGMQFDVCGYTCPSGYRVHASQCDEATCGVCPGGGPNQVECRMM